MGRVVYHNGLRKVVPLAFYFVKIFQIPEFPVFWKELEGAPLSRPQKFQLLTGLQDVIDNFDSIILRRRCPNRNREFREAVLEEFVEKRSFANAEIGQFKIRRMINFSLGRKDKCFIDV